MTQNNLVIYTAMFGDYDVVLEPLLLENDIDYVCFTDTPQKIPPAWETRNLNVRGLSYKLQSGCVKTMPHRYLSEYDTSIWVDANIVIKGQMKQFAENSLQSSLIAVPKHRHRSSVYEEMRACIEEGIVDPESTNNLSEQLRKAGFPNDYGLSETRVLVRRHNHPAVVKAMETWWNKYSGGPERDQFTFDYSLWKTELECNHLDPLLAESSSLFEHYPHKADMIRGELYEDLLRKRWNPKTRCQLLVGRGLFPMYMGFMIFIWTIKNLKKDGIQGVLKSFYRRYLMEPYR